MKRSTTFAIASALALIAVPLCVMFLFLFDFPVALLGYACILPVVFLFIGRSEYHRWQKWSAEIRSGRLLSSGVSPQQLALRHTFKRTLSFALVVVGGAYLIILLSAYLTTFETVALRTFLSVPLVKWLGTIVPIAVLLLVRAAFHDWDVRRSERLL